MKSFKNYTPRDEKTKGAGTAQTSFDGVGMEELTKQLAAAYEGKSSMDMMASILSQAESSKRAGMLTNAQIDEFYAQFSPMLNDFQRKKLGEIVKRLKEI